MNGILIVDKPQGLTSHDVVDFIRKHFDIKKVGHAGTLDPLATGVLVLLLGNMTKQASKFMNDDKEYEATLSLGVTTDSCDALGKILSEKPTNEITEEAVRKAFDHFQGEIMQVPPMVSALKFKGERLYKLARQGKVVPRNPRKVTLYKLAINEMVLPKVSFHLTSSKGTYVRTLCHDIGERLGCGAHMSQLRRVRSGNFSIEDSVTLPVLKKLNLKALATHVRTTKEPV